MTTAAHIGRLIRDGAGDFYVRQKAIDILMARGQYQVKPPFPFVPGLIQLLGPR